MLVCEGDWVRNRFFLLDIEVDAIERKIGSYCQDIRSIHTPNYHRSSHPSWSKTSGLLAQHKNSWLRLRKVEVGWILYVQSIVFHATCQSCCERRIFYKYTWAILVIEDRNPTQIALGLDILFWRKNVCRCIFNCVCSPFYASVLTKIRGFFGFSFFTWWLMYHTAFSTHNKSR